MSDLDPVLAWGWCAALVVITVTVHVIGIVVVYRALRSLDKSADAKRVLPRQSVEKMVRVDLSNPLTALIATALSWSGLIGWTLSWFVLMPLLSTLLAKSYRAVT
jgi:uncharacterized membrane protein YwzB